MIDGVRHLLRLAVIARTLARHRVLLPLLLRPTAPERRPPGRRFGERLAAALHDLGPSFIKLGQALSVRPDVVGEELANDLAQLRDRLPPFAAAAARATIAAELERPLESLFQSFDDQAVAAASMAQVHFAVTSDGTEVAVKVLRPGIENAFRRDLDLLHWLAARMVRWQPRLARLRPTELVDTLARSVAFELDLRLEAAAASELAENLADDPLFRVPRIDWPRTARRVLTMQRIDGIPIDRRDELAAAGHDLPALATRVLQVFLRQALWHGFFHADMHHGNLFVAADGTLIAVDFGIMGRLDRPTRLFMAELLHAFLSGDWQRAAEVHFRAGYVPPGQPVESFAQACRSIGEGIVDRPVDQISMARLLAQLFQVTETFAMPARPELLLLQKTMVVTEGVARTLDPQTNFWAAARPVISEFIASHLAPEARLREVVRDGADLVQQLPRWRERIDRAVATLPAAPGEWRAAEAGRSGRGGMAAALWLIVGLLAVLVLRAG